jgi:hypothetical protein
MTHNTRSYWVSIRRIEDLSGEKKTGIGDPAVDQSSEIHDISICLLPHPMNSNIR